MKKALLFFVGFVLISLACTVGSGKISPTATPASGLTRVRVHPEDGGLVEQLKVATRKATDLGQKPFLEFDASW